MTQVQSIAAASDRVMATLIAGLEIEFGAGADVVLARRFIAAEEGDFLWDARVEERWLGAYESLEDSRFELDRIAIWGQLDGQWFAAVCLVDGDGVAHGLLERRLFGRRDQARKALATAY